MMSESVSEGWLLPSSIVIGWTGCVWLWNIVILLPVMSVSKGWLLPLFLTVCFWFQFSTFWLHSEPARFITLLAVVSSAHSKVWNVFIIFTIVSAVGELVPMSSMGLCVLKNFFYQWLLNVSDPGCFFQEVEGFHFCWLYVWDSGEHWSQSPISFRFWSFSPLPFLCFMSWRVFASLCYVSFSSFFFFHQSSLS